MKSTPEEDVTQGNRKGLPIATDSNAQSASADLLAFLAKPIGAPVYHRFRILEDVTVDGFMLGVITDFEVEPALLGDGFVVAPDGNRAGLRLGDLRHSPFPDSLRANRRALRCVGSVFLAPYDESTERSSKPCIGIAGGKDEVGSLAAVAPRPRTRRELTGTADNTVPVSAWLQPFQELQQVISGLEAAHSALRRCEFCERSLLHVQVGFDVRKRRSNNRPQSGA